MDSDNTNEQSTRRSNVVVFGILAAILAVGLVVRLIGLESQSLTMDECFERDTATMELGTLVQHPNSFPPLYHLMLKGWLGVDQSEIAVRWFSVICGMLSLVILWWLVRYFANDRLAWWSVLLAAISPFHIYYSQEGRSYILYLLFALLAVAFLVRWMESGSLWDGAGFVVASVAGLYTHYFFVVVLVTLGIGCLAMGKMQFVMRKLVPAGVLIGLLGLPLLFLVGNDLDYQKGYGDPRPMDMASVGYTYFSLFSGYTLGPSRSELHMANSPDAIQSSLIWLGLATVVAIPLLVLGARNLRQHGNANLWLVLLILPIPLLWIICTVFGVTYNTRFLNWLWIPFCILMAAGIASIDKQSIRYIAMAALAGIFAIAIYNRHSVDRYRNEDLRAVAEYIQHETGRPVLVCAAYMHRPLNHYLRDRMELVPIGPGKPEVVTETSEQNVRAWRDKPFWLVYTREFHSDPQGDILRRVMGESDPQPVFVAAGVRVYSWIPQEVPEQVDDVQTAMR